MRNLKESFYDLYSHAGHKVVELSHLFLGDSCVINPDFNVILNSDSRVSMAETGPLLKECLVLANQQDYPFLFVQDKALDGESEALLKECYFNRVAEVECMYLDHLSYDLPNSESNYAVVRVDNDGLFKQWCHVLDQGFGFSGGVAKAVFDPAKDYIYHSSSYRLYLLLINNEPVSVSILYCPEDKSLGAGHYAATTKPEYRKKGVMTYLGKHLISIAIGEGYEYSVAQCYDTSVRLVEQLGFKAKETLSVFSNAAHLQV